MATSIPIAVRGSVGVNVLLGPPNYGPLEQFTPVPSKSSRVIAFSPDGKYFAYVYANVLKIVRTDTWSDVATIEGIKAYFLVFSPKSTYLMSWEPYEVTKANPNGSPNLNIYKSEDGQLVKGFVHKSPANWEPKWSEDEQIFAKIVNTDVVFYENCNFECIVNRIKNFKVVSYSISPIIGTYYIICHVPGTSGQPALAKLFKYPNFEGTQALANKSFFQADKVDYYWNEKGTHALLLASTEMDKTGKSYYGKQTLHFVGVNGQTNLVALSKEGSIYSVSWSPKGQEFCVVYGFMPAKATLFNLKCEPIFEFGTGPRNSVYYNPQGNILLLGGFGNLSRGSVELWDTNTRKIIGKCEATDSTLLEWSPDGTHFMTATTAPRLRIGNGYKIWHYTGALVFEKFMPDTEELYDATWQKFTRNTFKPPTISAEKVQAIASKQVQASTQAYRPPSARNKPGVTFNLHDDDEPARKSGADTAVSKNALKQRKKREARKAKKAEESDTNEPSSPLKENVCSSVQVQLTNDPEVNKKIRNIKKKLDAIEKLKSDQAQGKPLEINQLAKIKAEQELVHQLQGLQI